MKKIIVCLLTFPSMIFGLVNTETMRKYDLKPGYTHTFSMNVSSFSGNSAYSLINTRFRTDYSADKNQAFVVANLKEGSSNRGGRFAHSGFLHARGVHSITHNLSSELFVQKEFQEFLKITDRTVLGAGVRVRGNDTVPGLKWYSGTGLMWEDEKVNGDFDKTLVRFTNYFTFIYNLPKDTSLSSVTYYQPHASNFSDYRILTSNRLNFNMTRALTFFMQLNARFDSLPSIGVQKLDVEFTNGFSVEFSALQPETPKYMPPETSSSRKKDSDAIEVPVPVDDKKSEQKDKKNTEKNLSSPG